MGVAVDQTRHGHHAGAVDNGFGSVLGGAFFNGDDFAVLNADIHGVDSYKLLAEINKQAAKVGRIIPCLLQIHIAQEETKFGFSMDECRAMLAEGAWKELKHVQIAGVMGMGTNTDDEAQTEREFASLQAFFHEVKQAHFADNPHFCEISMGMSDDYPIAIRHESTLIRVGSRIFGERMYKK